MPILTTNQFDRAIQGTLVNGALVNQFQALQLKIGSDTDKIITGVECGYALSDFALGATDILQLARATIRGRLVIFLDSIEFSAYSAAQLIILFSPINPFVTTTGVPVPNNVLLDMIVTNSLLLAFTKPIVIPQGQNVTVLLGMGFIDGDSTITPVAKNGYLNVHGSYNVESENSFLSQPR